jgi:hypothetical protein
LTDKDGVIIFYLGSNGVFEVSKRRKR